MVNGCFELDEDFLRKTGGTDFESITLFLAVNPAGSCRLTFPAFW